MLAGLYLGLGDGGQLYGIVVGAAVGIGGEGYIDEHLGVDVEPTALGRGVAVILFDATGQLVLAINCGYGVGGHIARTYGVERVVEGKAIGALVALPCYDVGGFGRVFNILAETCAACHHGRIAAPLLVVKVGVGVGARRGIRNALGGIDIDVILASRHNQLVVIGAVALGHGLGAAIAVEGNRIVEGVACLGCLDGHVESFVGIGGIGLFNANIICLVGLCGKTQRKLARHGGCGCFGGYLVGIAIHLDCAAGQTCLGADDAKSCFVCRKLVPVLAGFLGQGVGTADGLERKVVA